MTDLLIQNALETPDGTILVSSSVHDYKNYKDSNGKQYMVDGGLHYLRRNIHDDQTDLSVYEDTPFEQARERLVWGSYGVNGDEPLHYIKLKDMDNDHIEKVVHILVNKQQLECPSSLTFDSRNFLRNKYRLTMMIKELKLRVDNENN